MGSYGPTNHYDDRNYIDFTYVTSFPGGIKNPLKFEVRRFEVIVVMFVNDSVTRSPSVDIRISLSLHIKHYPSVCTQINEQATLLLSLFSWTLVCWLIATSVCASVFVCKCMCTWIFRLDPRHLELLLFVGNTSSHAAICSSVIGNNKKNTTSSLRIWKRRKVINKLTVRNTSYRRGLGIVIALSLTPGRERQLHIHICFQTFDLKFVIRVRDDEAQGSEHLAWLTKVFTHRPAAMEQQSAWSSVQTASSGSYQ